LPDISELLLRERVNVDAFSTFFWGSTFIYY
jgi:hypothetical protein